MPSSLEPALADFLRAHAAAMTADQWSVHGLTIECRTDDPILQALMRQMLRNFPRVEAHDAAPHIRMAFTTAEQWPVPRTAMLLPPSTNEIVDTLAAYGLTTTFAREGPLNYYEISPMGGAAYDITGGLVMGYVRRADQYSAWQVIHLYLLILLLELLRGQKLFWVHAGSVAALDQGVLLVGHTGSGKTTTVVNLVESGFHFLSEDRTLIRVLPDGVEILGLPIDVAVTSRTLELVPSLGARVGEKPVGRRKLQLNPSDVFPDAIIPRAAPSLLLFPRVTEGADTSLHPVDGAAALRRLLPNSLLASHPDVTRQHFQALSELVNACRCFELRLGSDMAQTPERIRSVLRYVE